MENYGNIDQISTYSILRRGLEETPSEAGVKPPSVELGKLLNASSFSTAYLNISLRFPAPHSNLLQMLKWL